MKRRDFITKSTTAAAIPIMLNGMNLNAYGENSMLQELYTSLVSNDHVLVIIQMSGGNDGLNMVIPIDQYSKYFNARTNIAVNESKILTLTGNPGTGLNPAMTGMRDMYNNGNLCIVHSVGYPSPSFSHFRATDIWLTASNSNEVLSNGWLGRFLNGEYPGFPNGYPTATMKDPLGIQFGSGTSLALLGPAVQMGYTISNPNNIFGDNAAGDPVPPATPAGDKLTYLRQISTQANKYSIAIQSAYTAGAVNTVTYPTSNPLADQLKVIARLIHGGLQTKIFIANIGGFDTHSGQTNGGDNDTGTHATLLGRLSSAVKAFHDDLKQKGKDQKVIGMTFSEFGRRIKSNGSTGTDHGAAAPMFLFGTQVTSGAIGTNPILPTTATVNDNIPYQHDFRSVYWSLMKRWLCQDDPSLVNTMLQSFQELDVVSDAECTPPPPINAQEKQSLVNAYPNPVISDTQIEFKVLNPGHVLIQLVSPQGRVMRTVYENQHEPIGTVRQRVNLAGMQMGTYYIRYQSNTHTEMKAILKVQ
jgi:uncharacterized protein (DUF1501 family)